MKQILLHIVLLVFLILPFSNAYGDAAPDPLNKGITPARKGSRVQLVSEQVDIYLGTDRCDIDATFVLRNSTPVAEKMEVGFPTSYENEVKNPLLWVDGKRVFTRSDLEKEIERGKFEGKPYKRIYKTHWVLWDMTFGAEQTRTIRIRYWVKPRKNGDITVTPYTKFGDDIMEAYKEMNENIPVEISLLTRNITSFSTGYILRTGSGWRHVIEKAVINVHHKKKGICVLRRFEPKRDFKIQNNKLVWTFEYLDPDFDIEIEYNDHLTLDQEISAVEKIIDSAEHPEGLAAFLNYLYGIKKNMQH